MSDTDLAFRAQLDASGFASGAQQLTGHLNQLGIQTNSATANLGGLGTLLGTMANPATAAALGITAIGGAIASSVSVAGDFQQKMAGVNAIVGGSAADMKTLSDAAREAGASTSFSASQAADALGFMAGAGWDVSQSTAALKDTLTLAAAGGMDLAQAGDMMTNTVSQFGLAATDSARVANVLAAGASATNTNVSQLGEGMKVVGATANAFGMSLESTTAALGSLSNAGIKGSEGGTALRGILASLATQTGPAAAALAELGLSSADVNPEMVSLSDSMTLLNERGMTATQAIAIFGRENVSAATYMAAHASSLDDLQTSISGTSKASEMAAIQTATYQGAMGELSSAVEEAEIALGSVLLPVVTDSIKVFTGGVEAVTNFGKGIYDMYTTFQDTTLAESDKSFLSWLGVDTDTAKAAGDQAATDTAAGITDNKDLQTATGETLGSDASKTAVKKSADDLAKEFTQAYGSQFEAGMTLINGKWTSQAAAVADKITEQTVQYNDQEYVLRSINSGENMIYEIRSKSTGELIRQSEQMRQTNELLTSMAWASQYGYEAITRTITFDFIVNKDAALKSKMEELGDSVGSALKDHIIDAAEQDTLTELAAKFVSMGGDASDALISAIQRKDWGAVGRTAGEEAGKSFAEAMNSNFGKIEYDWNKIWSAGFLSGIEDLTAFQANAFQPELISLSADALDRWNFGTDEYRTQARQTIGEIEILADRYKWLYTDAQMEALDKYAAKQIDEKTLLEALTNKTDELTKSTKKFTEDTDEATAQCGQLLSLFGAWQETTPELFYPQYLGPSYGQDFEEQLIAKAASVKLAADGNDRYAQSINGVYVELSDANKALSEYMYYFYHEDEIPIEVRLDAMKALGMQYDATAEQAANFAKAIEGVNLKFDSAPQQIDRMIEFKTVQPDQSNVTEIQSAVTLDTTVALSEFEVFRANIEGQTITANLSLDTRNANVSISSGSAQQQNQVVYLQAISNTATRIQGNVLAMDRNNFSAIWSTSKNQITAVDTNANTISTAVSGASTAICGEISISATQIIEAINNLNMGGGGGYSGSSGGSGSGSSGGSVGGGWSWDSIYTTWGGYYFASGGHVSQPTIAMIGEGGEGEWIVPDSQMQTLVQNLGNNVSISMELDASGISQEIESVLSGLSVRPIRVPLVIDFDSDAVAEAVEAAMVEFLANKVHLR